MKGSEQQDMVTLGTLKAIIDLMEVVPIRDKENRDKFNESRKLAHDVFVAHWDKCSKLITEDET